MSQVLKPLEFPLSGTRLIEASAGTGKTFTIAALYLRLILGHGLENHGSDLLPADILVVTFTEAATKELRDRIRERLSSAALFFRQQTDKADPFLTELRQSFDDTRWLNCARRLELAANWMDESAVYTIHGWCNRMLQQHAFDSGSLFRQQVNTDDADLLNQAIRDYWRSFYYPLAANSDSLQQVYQYFKTPDALQAAISQLIAQSEFLGDVSNANSIAALCAELNQQQQSQLTQLKQPWLIWVDEVRDLIDEAVNSKTLPAKNYNVKNRAGWFDKIRTWANDPHQVELDIGTGFKNLSPDGLATLVQDGKTAPSHPAFQALSELPSQLAGLPNLKVALIAHAVQWVKQRYVWEKQRLAQMSFDDMLTRLESALYSPQGEHLAEVIRQQFPIAMIDEFQDTDPVQYRIFAKLYPPEADSGLGCFMIGDPKQAIYSFRGADIFTYLKAHQATQGKHYTLNTNYRSSQSLVKAVNRLFLNADQNQPQGAFLFKQDQQHNPLAFIDVDAKGRDEVWQVNGQSAQPLTLWHQALQAPIGVDDYRQTLAQVAASEIVALLNSAETGFKSLKDKPFKPLQPGDIAILVRSSKEAKLMREALAARKLRSVYLSERDSIYSSQEAQDLLIWLKALAEPRDERKVRAALSTATLAWSYQQLHTLVVDESLWEVELERFLSYQQRWQQDGILPTLRQLINDYRLHVQLNAANNGERCLTNLLHLAELLQQASAQLEGEQALIRHLAEAIAGNQPQSSEDTIIRLESDANLIKIVTIHKSKGLEYPLVFLPFICSFREVAKRDDFYRYHDAEQNLCIDLNKDDAHLAISDKERLQEDLRLLYVAMTRAQHACWLGLAPVKKGNTKSCQLEKSAIGYLLGWQPETESARLGDYLQALSEQTAEIEIVPLPIANDQVYQAHDQQTEFDTPAQATVKVADNWWIASYSSLNISEKTVIASSNEEPELPEDSTFSDEAEDEVLNPVLAMPQIGVQHLPRGSGPGILVHGLLEQCGRAGFAYSADNPEQRQKWIEASFKSAIWADKQPIINTALQHWLTMPLFDDGFGLADLQAGQYQVEMEFLIGADEVEGVDVQRLDQAVSGWIFKKKSRPSLLAKKVSGLLKGFIDLVFVHNGQYFVADYKFNYLGDRLADYDLPQLQTAMLDKRYDLQLVLYALALHRLLKNRLPDYDYQTHVGGGLYLFLRGAEHSSQGRVLLKPDFELIDYLDGLFKGGVK